MDDLPHLALPLRVVGSAYAPVQQDTGDEVACTVAAICAFPRGYRAEQPEFGITDPTFSLGSPATAELEAQVAAFEPRAALTVTTVDDLAGHATVRVEVALSGSEEV